MVQIPRHLEARHATTWAGRIPRRIAQTFESDRVPQGMYDATQSWRDHNPDHEYTFADDEARRAFIAEHFDADQLRCYDKLPAGAFRADLWRYCTLYVHGGVYADLDTICKMPLADLVSEDDEFVVAHGKSRRMLFNGFICCAPRHPFLEATIERATQKVLDLEYEQRVAEEPFYPFFVVGPGGLAAGVNQALGRATDTEFTAGCHELSGIRFRILWKMHFRPLWLRRVMLGPRTVLMCKYRSYGKDLEAAKAKHWSDA